MKVGQGFDVHRFVTGPRLVLGGVEIEHPQGLDGHSDADVLTHAVVDALLGAAGMGDIGTHFPDTDPAYLGASSIGILETVSGWIRSRGFEIANIDVTVFAENPRLGAYRTSIVEKLAQAARLPKEHVNLKATTTEKLGFIGRGEGIAASAIVLLEE